MCSFSCAARCNRTHFKLGPVYLELSYFMDPPLNLNGCSSQTELNRIHSWSLNVVSSFKSILGDRILIVFSDFKTVKRSLQSIIISSFFCTLNFLPPVRVNYFISLDTLKEKICQ